MLAQHGIVSGVEGFWPDGQENDGAGTAFPRPPSVRPEREREKSLVLESVCMEAGITGGGGREGRPSFSLRAILSSFHTAEGGREGRQGGRGQRRPGKEGQ